MHRVANILNDRRYRDCLELNAASEVDRRFCRHDRQHMLDVSRIAYMLLLESGCGNGAGGGDHPTGADGVPLTREIVYAAGLLHDMARWVEYRSGEDHAVASARLAVPVLDSAGFNAAEIDIITAAIRGHRTGGEGAGLLGMCISRADDLSRQCSCCKAREECYKVDCMETAEMLLY